MPVIAIGECLYCDYKTIITIILLRYSTNTVRLSLPQVTVVGWPQSLLLAWKQVLFLYVILCCCFLRAFIENTIVSDRRLLSEIISPLGTYSDASCLDTGCRPWNHTAHDIQFLWFYSILVPARYFYHVDRKDREPEGNRHLFQWPLEGRHYIMRLFRWHKMTGFAAKFHLTWSRTSSASIQVFVSMLCAWCMNVYLKAHWKLRETPWLILPKWTRISTT